MNQSLTLAFLIAAGIGLVVQNTLMVRITQTSSTILIAMLLNSLVGIVLFVSILWFKQGMAGFGELVSSVRWWSNFTCGWRLVGSQTLILIRGWCRLWLTVRGALPYLLYACDRDEQ